jgi:hypothetical protein
MRDKIATALQVAGTAGMAAAGWMVDEALGLLIASVGLLAWGFILGVLDRREREG